MYYPFLKSICNQSTIYNYEVDDKSMHNFKIGYGFDLSLTSGWSLVGNFERFKAIGKGYSNEIYLSAGYVPNDKMKLVFNLNNFEGTTLSLNNKINDFDLKISSNYEFLKNTSQVKYNDDDKSSIVINTYGQKPLNEETINFLKNKLQKYSELRNAELEFIQNDISLPNSNKFVNELRKRDSMELVSKNNEINKLNQKLNDLESLSKEKLIFKSLAIF